METRKGAGRETDTTREIDAEARSVAQTAQEIEIGIEIGIVPAPEKESTRNLRMSMN